MASVVKTIVTYTLTGTDKEFNIPFDYLARKFIVVTLVGPDRRVLTLNHDYRFATKTTISTTQTWGPESGYTQIEISRNTSASTRLVDFADGSILRSTELNISQLQALHVAEEARDVMVREVQPSIDKITTAINKAVHVDDFELEALPPASERANKLIGFDATGQNIVLPPAEGSAADVLLELRQHSGADWVGTESGSTVQKELDAIKASAGEMPKDVFIGSFFNSNNDVSMTLVKSFDGEHFSVMNKKTMYTETGERVGNRDPSILYHKGEWWVATTGGGVRDLDIWKSRDLMSWTKYPIKARNGAGLAGQPGSIIGGTIPTLTNLWAPSLFVDTDGELYAQLTLEVAPKAPDRDGQLVNFMAPFSIKCLNTETMLFGDPVLMMPDKSVQRIDVEVTKVPDGYVMLLKNEFNKQIEIWKSATYIGGYRMLASLDFGGRYVEGASMVRVNRLGVWRIYADAFREAGNTWFVDTKDFATFTAPKKVQCPNPLRHGTVYNISESYEAMAALNTYITAAATMATDYLPPKFAEGGQVIDASNFAPQENYVYKATGNTSLVLDVKQRGGDFFYVYAGTGAMGGITVQGALVDGVHQIGYGVSNLSLVKFEWNDWAKKYCVVGKSNDIYSYSAVTTIPGWPNVSPTWTPQHKRTYATSGAMETTVISGISNACPNGTEFYIWIGSASAKGAVTFKARGTNLAVYAKDVTFSGATGYGDALITVRLVQGSWRVIAPGSNYVDGPATMVTNGKRGVQQFLGKQNNAYTLEVPNGYITGYQNDTADGNVRYSGWYFRVPALYSQSRGWFEIQNA